jgi:hypothetical protein
MVVDIKIRVETLVNLAISHLSVEKENVVPENVGIKLKIIWERGGVRKK